MTPGGGRNAEVCEDEQRADLAVVPAVQAVRRQFCSRPHCIDVSVVRRQFLRPPPWLEVHISCGACMHKQAVHTGSVL